MAKLGVQNRRFLRKCSRWSDQASNQIEELVRAQNPISQSVALSTTIGDLQRSWSVISHTNVGLTSANREQMAQMIGGIANFTQQNQATEATTYLNAFRQLTEALGQEYFWRQEPFRFLEVLMWGLAGVFVNLITKTGSYLRWRRFYREGVYLHIAQIVTVPLLAVVFVFLLSTVQLTINITSAGDISLELTDPRILAAVSFLIGARPWAIWDFIQETAGRLTGRPQGT